MNPPRSQTNYAYFHVGELETDDGVVTVGKLMYAGPHAPQAVTRQNAAEHYDKNTHVAAYLRATDGIYGVWVSGALKPGLTEADLAEIRVNPPSGDWRRVNGSLEMIAALAVPVPGLPIPRAETALVASAGEFTITSLLMTSGQIPMTHALVDAMVASGVMSESEAEVEREWVEAYEVINGPKLSTEDQISVLSAAAAESPIEALIALAEEE